MHIFTLLKAYYSRNVENFLEFSCLDVKFHQFLKQNFIPGLFQHCLTQRAVKQSAQCYIWLTRSHQMIPILNLLISCIFGMKMHII